MIEVGTVLQNRYRIEKQIGQGGMGRVYVASDQRFNSVVAIKQTVFEDKNLRRAFEREAHLLNSLKHLALPRVSDHFTENDGQFLVMEFVAGEDLAEMMVRAGAAFPLEKVLDWTNQLCDALEYLHAQDIIHRDIKPQNLKLTPGGQIVLLDFGLAKGNPTDSNNQTAAKSIFGYSRSYASLEQIQGTGTEPRSDLYSLAATLYHLLTGVPPADALTRAMNVLNKQPDPLVPANIINRNIPADVADVLQKSMALNAGERPVSATALQQMLDESDKRIDSNAAPNVSASNSLSTDFLTQETKLKPLVANATANRSGLATQIAATKNSGINAYQTTIENNDSIVTSVRSEKSSSRTRKAAIGVVGSLILAGGAISAAYFYNPQTSQKLSDPTSNSLPTNFVVQTNDSIQNGNVAAVNTASSSAVNTSAKSSETASSAKSSQSQKDKSGIAKSRANKNQRNDDNDGDDGVTFNEDSLETKDMIIDENGIRMKVPRGKSANPPKIASPQIPYRGLTPEQIQKLRELKNLQNRRFVFVKPPTPQPTP